ncbi:MAG: pyridoxamine 5'-phosphate oxidase family protein [Caulobacteraceae bacterium]
MKLSAAMRALVERERLGFVASVNDDGTPNVSPKGTFVVLDDERLAFLDVRSPMTSANLAARPAVEVNFVDPILRKGLRCRGRARVLASGTAECEQIVQAQPLLARPAERYRALVIIEVKSTAPLISPAYDDGASEDEVSAGWKARWRARLAS